MRGTRTVYLESGAWVYSSICVGGLPEMGTNVEREVTLRTEKYPMQFLGPEGVAVSRRPIREGSAAMP